MPDTLKLLVRFAPLVFVLLWSTGFIGARFGLPHADPLTFTAIRFAIVTIVLLVIARIRNARGPAPGLAWVHLAVSGVLIHSCFVGGVFYAIDRGVDVSIAAVITGAQPILTAAIAATLLTERLRRIQWLGFVIGFVGLSMVVLPSYRGGGLDALGLVACVLALIGITLGTLYQKRFPMQVDLFFGSAIQFASAAIVCALWAFAYEQRVIEWNITVSLTMTWMCLALSVGAVSILLLLIRNDAASRVSSLFYLVPPATAVQGYLFFDQTLNLLQCLGVAVTAAAVAMIIVDPGKSAAV
ncbi:MAG: DMT family transporter [Gammaproteobacteria bacterium]